jgi:putative ABC transport system substrate-binding protein
LGVIGDGIANAAQGLSDKTSQNIVVNARLLLAFGFSLGVAIQPLAAQQLSKIPTVGILTLGASPDYPVIEGLRQGLRDLGYVEGRTIRFEFRSGHGDVARLPSLAQELIGLQIDAVVVGNPTAAQALRRASSTTPIVIAAFDPVATGLVTNLARPGGNVTGTSSMTTELAPKRLQLLKEAIPRLSRVGVLWNSDTPWHVRAMKDIESQGAVLSIKLDFIDVRTPAELGSAFSSFGKAHDQAIYVLDSSLSYLHRASLINLASKARLPTVYGVREFADEGGLMTYGVNYVELWRPLRPTLIRFSRVKNLATFRSNSLRDSSLS